MNRHQVLISGDFGSGKSVLLLAYSQHLPEGEIMLSFDWENGQIYYVAPTPEQVNPAKCKYYARRLLGPTLYELKAITARLCSPTAPSTSLLVDRAPINPELLRPEIRETMLDINKGTVKIGAVGFDTITRFCELTTSKVFLDAEDRMGKSKAENVTQLTWAKVKDDISEVLYQLINVAQVSLIMTAWTKPRFDQETRRSTSEMIADVLKNVNAFSSLSLMLTNNQDPRIVVPRATVVKSRLVDLPRAAVLPQATWDAILAAEPKFDYEIPEEVA